MKPTDSIPLLSSASRPTILIVDDDEAIQDLVNIYTQEQGFQTRSCPNAETALEDMRKFFCPIVITDVQMPGMGGLSLCRKLRTGKWPGYVYIIVMTGHDQEDGVVEALDAGADDYLHKGAPPAELRARLRVAERIVTLEQRLRRTLESKARQAASDALTGLPNRRTFDRRLNAEFKRARRFGEPISVLLIDADHFKQVNDQYGHHVGDEVLRRLAATLREHLPREYDVLARIGGEEFAAVLPHTSRDDAATVAERLRAAIESTPFATAAGKLRVTVSIGIGSLSNRVSMEPQTTLDVLDEADRGLYESKRLGRNQVTVAPATEPRTLLEVSS
ncbi:diguanylate cyclase response regulator [Steroidobacter agaridevorans]|uniref:diguanylate cyclase n=1 Tax=Steroidobacter agaridevorans TaxID=2695856 RepID=A0A829YIR8_9GAMM|nr:diguanylate cyclase [Steroidobacter agaridevorans]GFE82761.1 diguanylate cyclase response regulator [Steroidobacter agaridevorans]